MNRARPIVQSAAFVPGDHGLRFRLVSEPSDGEACGTVVFVHAFAEEMNKSRRMAARMARLLAAQGWRVVQRDLCGCGDSSGEFADATWSAWVADVDAELSQTLAGRPVWLWCERAGALLALPALAGRPDVRVLLWQPVLSGAQHLRQFLRLHAGARIAGTGGKSDGESSPMQLLRDGTTVEISGYQIAPALAIGLEQATFDLPAGHVGRVVVFEVVADDAAQTSPLVARLVERLRERGIVIESHALQGPPFWQTQEIEECEVLLQRCLEALDVPDRPVSLPPQAAPTRDLRVMPVSR